MGSKKKKSLKVTLRAIFKEISNDIWPLVGFCATWLVLTGSAKRVIGYVGIVAISIWITSVVFRIEIPGLDNDGEPDTDDKR